MTTYNTRKRFAVGCAECGETAFYTNGWITQVIDTPMGDAEGDNIIFEFKNGSHKMHNTPWRVYCVKCAEKDEK